MFRIFIFILLLIPAIANSQQCYELNDGKGLKLFSPFIMGTPLGVPQLKGSKFGDYVNSSLCNGKPKRWSIAAYNFNGKPSPIFAAHSGVVNIYTTTSITGEDGQANDALWINGDSLTTSYMGIHPVISNGQYVYAGQLLGRVYTDVNSDNFGFGIRRSPVLNPIQKRGYLPTEKDSMSTCACAFSPLWPEYFVNPASVRINYYAYNEILPEASLRINLDPGGIGKWSFDNGRTWLNSGDKISGLPFGYYKIIFKNEFGYKPPTFIQINVTPNNKYYETSIKYIPDYTILKRPEAELQREADKKLIDAKLTQTIDSLHEIMNADGSTTSLRNNIIDSLNTRFNKIENIQKDQLFFTKLFKYILPLLVLAMLFAGILFFQNVKIRKQKKNLENLQKEQHHRVHNSLGMVSSLLNTYKENITPEKLANIDNSIIAISTVHRQLYKGDDLENINFQPVAENISQSLLMQRGLSDAVKVNLDASIMISQKNSTILALMFNELFTNSLKYAFDKTDSKIISLTAIQDGGHISMIYKDNGKGYSTDFLKQKTTGFGRVMLDGLAHQLRAKINFYNEDGACCMIKL